MDIFANIATQGITFGDGLVEHEPTRYPLQVLALNKGQKRLFTLNEDIHDEKSLYDALADKRRESASYRENHAPKMQSIKNREIQSVMHFRYEDEDSKRDFFWTLQGKGSWEEVRIPHYTGPVGNVTAFYRFTKKLETISNELYLCFKAADYIARVYVNGRMVKEHEGLFGAFEAKITEYVIPGENTFVIEVINDYPQLSGGEKIYAATGPGWDDPLVGWHNCPCGFGLYQDVYFEWRNEISIEDVSVRTHEDLKTNTVTVDLMASHKLKKAVSMKYRMYEANFNSGALVVEGEYTPQTWLICGMGDSLTEAERKADGSLEHPWPLYCEGNRNTFQFDIQIESAHLWCNETPYLYDMQVEVFDENGLMLDNFERKFGIRHFKMDTEDSIKGMYYLNGKKIKLRGSNTMGFEQQNVLNKDYDQLIDDILLAKLCNMNFLRLTQRPVQREIYEYCDMLGLMIQTDLPLFGALRQTQVCEAIRQSEEMERLIRPYACCVVTTYINEPFPNANNMPHRNLSRPALQGFFDAASYVIHNLNPDRVIKPIDGDYNPPEESGLPDNHCYPTWYNGHGIDVGRLHKGYWLPTKPGWYVGCGEFGCEGLDNLKVMQDKYLQNWLPDVGPDEASDWSPSAIPQSQVGKFHYFFFKTPKSLRGWIEDSQRYQAYATSLMTRAFRRNPLMTSFAIHLFIDNFPAGWMKTIMDSQRRPKEAFFAYRNALKPVMVDIRTDRNSGRSGEVIPFEIFVCNDTNLPIEEVVSYQLLLADDIVASGESRFSVSSWGVENPGVVMFKLPQVSTRTKLVMEAKLRDSYHTVEFEVYPELSSIAKRVCSQDEKTMQVASLELSDDAPTKYILSYDEYQERKSELELFVQEGGRVILADLPLGCRDLFGKNFTVRACPMMSVHFSQVFDDHPIMKDFKENDFRYWFDSEVGYIKPFGEKVFLAEGVAMMLGGCTAERDEWKRAYIAGSFSYGKGDVIVSLIDLSTRVSDNPTAIEYLRALIQ